jgi:hypothetical protein
MGLGVEGYSTNLATYLPKRIVCSAQLALSSFRDLFSVHFCFVTFCFG